MNRRSFRRFGKTLLPGAIAVVFAIPASGQDAPAAPAGMPQDWSNRHVAHTNPETREQAARRGAVDEWERKANDPRFVLQLEKQQKATGNGMARVTAVAAKAKPIPVVNAPKVDWNVSLVSGALISPLAGGVAYPVFPAKYSFSVDAAPDCTNDFVVFAINAASSTRIVAFKDLYTEPTGAAGSCGARTGPSLLWAYDTGRPIITSPVLSLDGKSVAFIDGNGTGGSGARITLHVLRGKSGDGAIGPPLAPAGSLAQTTSIATCPPGSATACMLNAEVLTVQTPNGEKVAGSLFVDYLNDVGYLTDSLGAIYKVKNVFCTTSACQSANVAPSVAWRLNLGGGAALTSPVHDGSGHVFTGDQNGKVYMVTDNGTSATFVSTDIGKSIDDSVLIAVDSDPSKSRVFAFAGQGLRLGGGVLDHSNNAVVAQMEIASFPGTVVFADVGKNGNNIYSGAFDDKYYGATPASGGMYVCGNSAGNSNPSLYRIRFSAYPAMDSGAAASGPLALSTGGAECSPLTEFYNPGQGKDWLFFGVTNRCNATISGGCVRAFDVTSGFPAAATATVAASGGTSGIVIDNVSTQPQASSIYFGTLTSPGLAVKLTQQGLQ